MSLAPSTRVHLPRPFLWRISLSLLFPTHLSLQLSPYLWSCSLYFSTSCRFAATISHGSSPHMSPDFVPSSPVISSSSPPDSTSGIPPRILPSLPQYYTRRSRNVDVSADVPSSSSQPTYGLRPHPLPPVDRLGFSTAGTAVLVPTSYHESSVHLER